MGKRNLKRISLAQTPAAAGSNAELSEPGRGQGEIAPPPLFCHNIEAKLSGATIQISHLPTALQCLAPSVSPCFAFPCKVSVQMACMHG